MRNFRRTALALIVVVTVASLLNLGNPRFEDFSGNHNEYSFWLSLDVAISWLFAVGVGAIVARRSFVVPALSLAVFNWLVVGFILFSIAEAAGQTSFVEVLSGQLTGLLLLSVAAIIGATIGRWFYKHEIESSTVAV